MSDQNAQRQEGLQGRFKVRQVTNIQASWVERERGRPGIFTLQLVLDNGVEEYILEPQAEELDVLTKLFARSGHVTFDLERVVNELKGGRIEFRVDKGGIIHVPFGKATFEPEHLVDNLAALTDAVNRARPKEAKGQYFRSLTVASTMGPGIRVDVPGLLARAAA